MDASELCYLSALDLAAGYRARRFSPSDVVAAILSQIERLNPLLTAYCTVIAESAREEARAADEALRRGQLRGPLHGVPVSIKDLTLTRGVRTTFGSRIYEHNVPDEDAPLVERLKAAGAIILGKTNSSEFGWKSPAANLLFGPTRNPWNPELTSAGSSGGAGAAVASGMGPIALGGDGGGSIRQPGSFCGVVGLKPSFGLVPNYPPSVTDTFVSQGPLTRTVRDAALTLDVIAGPDERDWFSLPAIGADYLAACEGGIRGLRVAWSPDLGYAAVDPEVRRIAEAAARRFADLGCDVEEQAPGWSDPAELFHVLFYGLWARQIDELAQRWGEQMDPDLVAWIPALARPLSAYDVAGAAAQRIELIGQARRFFQRFDLLLTPTMTLPPFPVGISYPREVAGQPVRGMQWTAFTFPFNLTGQPAATLPCGWTADGLPIGLQVVGRLRDDATVLRACAAFEQVAPWADRRPAPDPAYVPTTSGVSLVAAKSPF